jgi:peptide/nickel transport system substrate-binding protein
LGQPPAPSPAAEDRVVHFSLSSDPTTLNPLFAHADAGLVESQLARLVFEPFFDLDERGRPVPALLAEMPTVANGGLSADGRTIVYRLRHGVKWSDGVPVTSADVLFTLHAIMNPNNPVASRDGYDLIDRADAPNPTTVRFHLRRAWAPAVSTFFAYGTTPQYVLPAHVLSHEPELDRAAFNASPTVGDGPFTFVRWTRGESLEYRGNPQYWRGAPHVDRLSLRIVPDPNTNLTVLRSHSLDFNLIAPVQQRALADSGLSFETTPTALIAGIALNVKHAPLDDPRVRRAIASAIDRGAISAKLTFGYYPVADSSRPRFSWAYDASVREPAFDARAADAALDAAGWIRGADGMRAKGGHPLALTYVQFPESTTGVRVATFVQAALRDRGIDVTVKSISNAQLFLPAADGGVLAKGDFDMAYVPWQMGADPDDRFLVGCTDGVRNYMGYCDPAVDALEAKAVVSPDETTRRKLYGQIDRIIARDVPIVFLFNPTYIYAYAPNLEGFRPNAFSPTWNAYEWRIR